MVLLRRWRASTRVQRRGLEPVLLLGAAILVLGLGERGRRLRRRGRRAMRSRSLFFAAFALVPAAFLLGLVRTRFFHTATVGRVIDRLARDPRSVRDALAEALGDPTLEVVYWLGTGYVDREGARAPSRGRARADRRSKEGVGALDHDAALCETPELLRDAAAAAALAMENARLEVELRARLEALRASRARIVEAGDAERRRLGRDLHDGAQQRLVALMIELQLARERFDDRSGRCARAGRQRVRQRPGGGRRAARPRRGHPSRRALPARAGRRAGVAGQPRAGAGRARERAARNGCPSPVETAAYFVVAEALTNVAKYADATHARVTSARERPRGDRRPRRRRRRRGRGARQRLRGLGDRVGALDGTLEVRSPRGEGTLVRARIPLGAA